MRAMLIAGILVALIAGSLVIARLAVAEKHPPLTAAEVVVPMRPSAPPIQRVPPDAAPRVAVVVKVTGRVERKTDTTWAPLEAGAVLSQQDVVRTAEGASAELDVGAIVLVDDRTELTVGEISASLAEVALTFGRVSADAGEAGGPTIRISTRDAEAFAETSAGAFDVLDSGTGHTVIAAQRGSVQVRAAGQTIDVPSGMASIVRAGQPATAPAPIPPSLFLKVRVAEQVVGATTPGAVISVDGVRLHPDASGTFSAPVPPGTQKIVILVEDAMGRRERKLLTRPTIRDPKLDARVTW